MIGGFFKHICEQNVAQFIFQRWMCFWKKKKIGHKLHLCRWLLQIFWMIQRKWTNLSKKIGKTISLISMESLKNTLDLQWRNNYSNLILQIRNAKFLPINFKSKKSGVSDFQQKKEIGSLDKKWKDKWTGEDTIHTRSYDATILGQIIKIRHFRKHQRMKKIMNRAAKENF